MEEGFEVVQENKLDFVQNVASNEGCFQLKEVTPEPSNLIQDNKSVDEDSIGITEPLIPQYKIIPPPGPEPIEADATKHTKTPTPESSKDEAQYPTPTHPIGSHTSDPIKVITPEIVKDKTSPGPECEQIRSVEDKNREGGLEVNE